MKKAVLVFILFIVVQIVVPIVGGIVYAMFFTGKIDQAAISGNITSPWGLSIMMLVIYAVLAGALYGFKFLSPDDHLQRHSLQLPLVVLALLFLLVPMSLAEEKAELPDLVESQLEGVIHNPLGIVCVALLGPIVEELTFRRAILGSLLEKGHSAVAAVIVSALAFSIVHFNPAQMPSAFVIGCFFGWMYVRTGSIIPSIVCHVLNNTLSVVLMFTPLKDSSFTDLTGGLTNAIIISVLCLAIAIELIRIVNKHTADTAVTVKAVSATPENAESGNGDAASDDGSVDGSSETSKE